MIKLFALQVPRFNSSVGEILYTSIQYTHNDVTATKRSSLSSDRRFQTSEQTVHNRTSVIITGLAKGAVYTFILCLGNKEGKGPCEEVEVTTPKTGDHNRTFRIMYRWPLIYISHDLFNPLGKQTAGCNSPHD